MLHRYAKSAQLIATSLSACGALVLCACGSSPTKDLPSTATASQPTQESAPAVTTAPLKDGGNQDAASARTNEPKSAKGEAPNASAPVAAEPALPPEAVQQFDKAVVHMSAGDTAAAEQEFKSLTSAYPTYAGPWINLGILQTKRAISIRQRSR